MQNYVAMLDRPYLGRTLDERFVAVMDFMARDGITATLSQQQREERERQRLAQIEVEKQKAAKASAAIKVLGKKWKGIDSAPRDGTPIIGIGIDGYTGDGYEIAQVRFDEGKWWLVNHIGYDLNGDEFQPVKWMAI